MNKTYYRGDMYFTDSGIGLGSEQMGYRPAVIIQNNTGNMYIKRFFITEALIEQAGTF